MTFFIPVFAFQQAELWAGAQMGEKGCSAGGRGYCLLVATKPKAIIMFGVMHKWPLNVFNICAYERQSSITNHQDHGTKLQFYMNHPRR